MHFFLSQAVVVSVPGDYAAMAQVRRETGCKILADEIAEKSPATMALGLRAFYRAEDMELLPALQYLEGELGKVLALEDAREGLAAFFAKRKPVWKGR